MSTDMYTLEEINLFLDEILKKTPKKQLKLKII